MDFSFLHFNRESRESLKKVKKVLGIFVKKNFSFHQTHCCCSKTDSLWRIFFAGSTTDDDDPRLIKDDDRGLKKKNNIFCLVCWTSSLSCVCVCSLSSSSSLSFWNLKFFLAKTLPAFFFFCLSSSLQDSYKKTMTNGHCESFCGNFIIDNNLCFLFCFFLEIDWLILDCWNKCFLLNVLNNSNQNRPQKMFFCLSKKIQFSKCS